MRKLTKILFLCDILVLLVIFGMLMADKDTLSDGLIRMHVVANSDSSEDQAVKLKVRDAITELLEPQMVKLSDPQSAREYLEDNLDNIRLTADNVLMNEGSSLKTKVTLCREEFPVRHYDTFSLPSGVYESLRITIGEGEGKNWWCVVFPSLCIPASSQGMESCAAGAGFSNTLTSSLTRENGYEISFFILDCIGKLENLFHRG